MMGFLTFSLSLYPGQEANLSQSTHVSLDGSRLCDDSAPPLLTDVPLGELQPGAQVSHCLLLLDVCLFVCFLTTPGYLINSHPLLFVSAAAAARVCALHVHGAPPPPLPRGLQRRHHGGGSPRRLQMSQGEQASSSGTVSVLTGCA